MEKVRGRGVNLIHLFANSIPNLCLFGKGFALVATTSGYSTMSLAIKTAVATVKYSSALLGARKSGTFTKTSLFFDSTKKKFVVTNLFAAVEGSLKLLGKVIPNLRLVQFSSKIFPYVNLALEFIEVVINHENFTKGGFTKENFLKVVTTILLPLTVRTMLSCVGIMSYGGLPVVAMSILAIKIRERLDSVEMGGVSDFLISIENTLCPSKMSEAQKLYLSVLGESICLTATSNTETDMRCQ